MWKDTAWKYARNRCIKFMHTYIVDIFDLHQYFCFSYTKSSIIKLGCILQWLEDRSDYLLNLNSVVSLLFIYLELLCYLYIFLCARCCMSSIDTSQMVCLFCQYCVHIQHTISPSITTRYYTHKWLLDETIC